MADNVSSVATRLLFGFRRVDDQIGRAFGDASNWTARALLPRPSNAEMATALTDSLPPALSRLRILNLLAADLSELGHRTAPIEVQPLTPDIFHTLYHPDCPTIGITALQGGTGFGIAGVSAANAHAAGSPQVNLLYLPVPSEQSLQIHDGSPGAAYASAGFLVDRAGQVYYGAFPSPVRLDWIDTPVGALAELANRKGVYLLVSPEGEQIAREKDLTDVQLRANGVATPPTVVVTRHNADFILPQLQTLFGTSSPADCGFVVKPTDSSCGQDVYLIDESDLEAIPFLCPMLLESHAGLVVQRRIASADLRGQDKQRLDWNLRVLATTQGTVDWEARVAPWGKRVNKSQGAEVWEVSRLWRELDATAPRPALAFDAFSERIDELSRRLCALYRTEFMGYDVIVTEDGLPWVIEVNMGNPGGLCTLAAMRTTTAEKLSATDALIRHWGKLPRPPRQLPIGEVPQLSAAILPSADLCQRALERAAHPDRGNAPLFRFLVHEAKTLSDEQRTRAYLALINRQRLWQQLLMTMVLPPLLRVSHQTIMRNLSGIKDTIQTSISDMLLTPWRQVFQRLSSALRPGRASAAASTPEPPAPEPIRDEFHLLEQLRLAFAKLPPAGETRDLSDLLSRVKGPAGTPFLKLRTIRLVLESRVTLGDLSKPKTRELVRGCIDFLHQLVERYQAGLLSDFHWLARAAELRVLAKMSGTPISYRRSLQLIANPHHPTWQALGCGSP